jgi:Uma2 family endonuclease
MAEPALKQDWTLESYLAWEQEQPERWEFWGGRPRLMTGGTQAHSAIGVNLTTYLKLALRGSPCRSHGSDLKVITALDTSRYPDALIDCAPFDPRRLHAEQPVVVFEVLSDGSKAVDLNNKLLEYGATSVIQQYVLIYQDMLRVVVWGRDAAGHLVPERICDDIEGAIDLRVGISLRMSEIYDEVSFSRRREPENDT